MLNPIKQIYDFNLKAGLLDKGYDDFLESSFQIEEALEGLKDLPYLAVRLDSEGNPPDSVINPKECARKIVSLAMMDDSTPLSDVDRLDKACDAIIFALGSIYKLGLNPQQATKALNVVMQHNLVKLGMPKDEHGKLTKGADFVGPEKELQKLLDKRL